LSSDPGDLDWAARNRWVTADPPMLVVPGFQRKRSEFAPAGPRSRATSFWPSWTLIL
jgi:hypothetical protein